MKPDRRAAIHGLAGAGIGAVASVAVARASGAGGGELAMLAPGVVSKALQSLAANFQSAKGVRVDVGKGTIQAVEIELAERRKGDLVILPRADFRRLNAARLIRRGSERALGRIRFGLAVRAGAPHPDISTPEAFRAALLAATSVACSAPSTGSLGGKMMYELLRRPEYAAVKVRLAPSAPAALAHGDAELALQSASELMHVPGIEMIGFLPPQINTHIDLGVALLSRSKRVAAAQTFVSFITAPAAASVWQRNGVDPLF